MSRHEPWEGVAQPMPPGAFAAAAAELGCEEAVIRALWQVESAGDGYRPDGTVTRRFEPHHMPRATWGGIGFDPAGQAPWRASLKIKPAAREAMFLRAYERSPEAALRASSWGGPQIMGFNAADAGCETALQMVQRMAEGEAGQLAAFVRLIQSWGLAPALRAKDWHTIEQRYNGGGFGGAYARKMQAAYRRLTGSAAPVVLRIGSSGAEVRRLQRALGIEEDGSFGPQTEAAVRRFQAAVGLPVDGVVGDRTWAALSSDRAAGAEVAPPKAQDTTDRLLDRVRDGAGLSSAVSAALTQASEALPGPAYQLLVYGAVALALVAAAAWLWRRRR